MHSCRRIKWYNRYICPFDKTSNSRSYHLQEFVTLTPQNTVYKLIGPVLVQQDATEAKGTVEKRLEFINGEMYVSSFAFLSIGW